MDQDDNKPNDDLFNFDAQEAKPDQPDHGREAFTFNTTPPAPEVAAGTPVFETPQVIAPPAAQKTGGLSRTWIIVIVVAVLLCCCCLAFAVFMYQWGGDWLMEQGIISSIPALRAVI